MKKKKETYNRSRMMINEFIVNFCTKHYLDDGRMMPDFGEQKYGFHGSLSSTDLLPPVGSLCKLFTAPHSKYYLSWFLEYKDGCFYMQSIEDHSICKWCNVTLQYIPLELTSKAIQFKYTDRQFKFHDRWAKLVKDENYWMVPMWSEFNNETGEVLLSIRWKFEQDKEVRKFPSWETLTDEAMNVFIEDVKCNRKNRK